MPFAATWMDLEIFTLSKASQNGHYLKSLQAINAKEDVEKKEPSYTVDGNVN